MNLYPVILCGGSGTRLWPMSRTALPKQLLALTSERTLLQQTVVRGAAMRGAGRPVLVCSEAHRFLVAGQLDAIGVTPHALVLEPVARNTAPAVAIAALVAAADPEAVVIVMPSDHVIGDTGAFCATVEAATAAAIAGHIVTFGIGPSSAVTGYGYIEQGERVGDGHCRKVARFVEKPDAQAAQRMLEAGSYLWNSGMFMLTAARALEALERHVPDVLEACREAIARGTTRPGGVDLDADAFSACRSISFDHAVMEHTADAVVIPLDAGWSDVGTWDAVWEAQPKDRSGNVLTGDVYTSDVSNTLITAQNRLVTALGVRDLVIVETRDAVLVAEKSAAQDVRRIVDHLQSCARTEHVAHRRVDRPWGYFESTDAGERFQVKRLVVNPGARLSLQMHHHRAEHWVVVQGTARVTCNGVVSLLGENQSTYIPVGATHRLENPGKVPVHIIEVQSGCYLGEDDIVRFEDNYDRA